MFAQSQPVATAHEVVALAIHHVTLGLSWLFLELRTLTLDPPDPVRSAHPGVQKEDLRVDEKACVQDNDVFVQDDPATLALCKNPFVQHFSPGDMHEEKKDDVFSIAEVHPPAMLHTFSAFVLKQRASVHRPASAVDNDDTVQRTAVAGREAGMADIQKLALRACYGGVVSQDETRRKKINDGKTRLWD